ncbi:uncharacterized protein LOC144873847 [Branchiostoma floridae x Branchiostoma japonicum]
MASDSKTSSDGPRTPQGVLYSELPHLVNSRGQYLFCKALLMIVHGLGGHCQRYEELSTELNKEGVLVLHTTTSVTARARVTLLTSRVLTSTFRTSCSTPTRCEPRTPGFRSSSSDSPWEDPSPFYQPWNVPLCLQG